MIAPRGASAHESRLGVLVAAGVVRGAESWPALAWGRSTLLAERLLAGLPADSSRLIVSP